MSENKKILIKGYALSAIGGVLILLGAMLMPSFFAESRVQYGPSAGLGPDAIKERHISDGIIANDHVSSTADIAFSKLATFSFSDLSTKLATSSSEGTFIYSNGSEWATSTPPGGTGYIVMSSGTTPVWGNLVAGTNVTIATGTQGQITISSDSVTRLLTSFTAGEAISAQEAVYVVNKDTASDASTGVNNTASVITFSFTVADQPNRALVCGIYPSSTGDNVSSVTYDSVAMTRVTRHTTDEPREMFLYYLANPNTGTNNVAVTHSAPSSDAMCISFNGVSQTGQPEVTATSSYPITTTPSSTITTVTDNSQVVMFIAGDNAGTFSNNTNWVETFGTDGSSIGDGGGPDATAGSFKQVATVSAAAQGGIIQIAIAPANENLIFKADASATSTVDGFVGFATAGISQGSSGDVYIGGLATGFTGLNAGDRYFISDTAGAISTSAGTVSVQAGVAASSTALIVTNAK